MLSVVFASLLRQFSDDEALIARLWAEVVAQYESIGRHYHTLQHLEALLKEIEDLPFALNHRECVLFSLFYHDFMYDPLASDNEEKSAEHAVAVLRQIGATAFIEPCSAQIMATKTHHFTGDHDTDIFTDADLAILGQPAGQYRLYATQVRKEYAVFPDEVFFPGRKAVLEHFLAKNTIYKTPFFQQKYEYQARLNLQTEIHIQDIATAKWF